MNKQASKGTNPKNQGAITGYEAELWDMADALRGTMDAAEYKHVVLGLVFLKYMADAFEELRDKLEAEQEQGADPEDRDEYAAVNVFRVPPGARWQHIKARARQPTIGQLVDDAMAGIERDNPALKDVPPKDYARQGLDKQRPGQLIDMIGNIRIGENAPGFRKVATLEEIARHGHVPTPGRHVGAVAAEDDGEPFADKIMRRVAEAAGQRRQAGCGDCQEPRSAGVWE